MYKRQAYALSAHPKINAIKEASGNISQVAQIAALCGDDLNIYSGNDDQIVPLLALGGKGVLSVAAHVAPQQIHDICQFWFDGKPAESAALQLQLLELCNVLSVSYTHLDVYKRQPIGSTGASV